MSLFDDQIRLASQSAGNAAEAELESARKVLCAVDGTKYQPLKVVIAILQDELDKLQGAEHNAIRRADRLSRELDAATVKIGFLETDVTALRGCVVQERTLRDSMVKERDQQIATISRGAAQRNGRQTKLIARLREELAQAQSVPISERQSEDKAGEGGAQTSQELSPFTVLKYLRGNYKPNSGTFTISQIYSEMYLLSREGRDGLSPLTENQVRRAFKALENGAIRRYRYNRKGQRVKYQLQVRVVAKRRGAKR